MVKIWVIISSGSTKDSHCCILDNLEIEIEIDKAIALNCLVLGGQ